MTTMLDRMMMLIGLFVCLASSTVHSWTAPLSRSRSAFQREVRTTRWAATDGAWEDLTTDGGVQKQIISNADGEAYTDGTVATISYVGTLAPSEWSAEEIVQCWLAEQQGYKDDTELQAKFIDNGIDEAALTNLDSFTEAYVQETLGVSAKIQCKKLIMAAKRLATTRADFPVGTEFDSQDNYELTIGPEGKVVSGMKIGVATMVPGETALLRIRSDYAYGGEGYRKRSGEVMVPPFATLQFEMTLN